MKILITGGLGFIGSWLAKSLLDQGYRVSIIDDESTGTVDNLFGYLQKVDQLFYSSVQKIKTLPDNYDVMVHLGSSVGVKNIVEEPWETMENSLRATEAALELARMTHCERFIFASTSEVYGEGMNSRFREEDDFRVGQSCYPRWSYAACKIVDEFMVESFCQKYNLESIILRFFNIVGPNQSSQYGMVLPRFIDAALQNKPLRIFDKGTNVRTFTSVFDCVKVLTKFLSLDRTERVYNIGSGNIITINELAHRVIELCDSNSRIEYVDSKDIYGNNFRDTAVRIPDISRLSKIIDTSKFQNLNQIITSMLPINSECLKLSRVSNV